MNPYFWLFALYALFITPVTVHGSVRLDGGVHWRLRLQVAGMPLVRRKKQEKSTEEETVEARELARGLFSLDHKLIWALTRDGSFARLMHAFHWESLYVHARLSFEDAALTAMSYALIRAVLETLQRCGALPRGVTGRVEADFHSQGTQAYLHGIFAGRLGNLAIAGARLAWAAARTRARLAMEEEQYAAASH